MWISGHLILIFFLIISLKSFAKVGGNQRYAGYHHDCPVSTLNLYIMGHAEDFGCKTRTE